MSRRNWALAALIALSAGCATVDERAPDTQAAPAQPPPVAVVKSAPVVTPAPAQPQPQPAVAAPPVVTPDAPRSSEIETLVADFARVRKLGPAEIAREQEVARQVFNQSRSDSARLRFAMALAVPGAPGSDDTRALDLLEPLVKTPAATLHGLAFLLSSHIQEQRRLAAQVAGLQQNLQGLQQNVQGLQQKLDAIKSLERSLSGRGESGTVRRK